MKVSNECLNKEGTIWGLKYLGLFIAAIVGIIVFCKYRFYIALISLFPGYFIGSWISAKLLPGNVQRWLYRNLPMSLLFGGRKIPPSWRNWFL